MKIWQVCFWVALFKWGFFGYSKNNLKVCGSARVSRPRCSMNKVHKLVLARVVLFRVVIHNVIVKTEDVLGCP